jgi:hypothetical protein
MASIVASVTDRPTVELDAEVIVGAVSSRRRIALEVPGGDSGCRLHSESRLLLAINPTIPFLPLEHVELREMARGSQRFYLQFPAWMDVQRDFAASQSQSVSGAIYLSRTDLQATLGVPGVLLLQVLPVDSHEPCLTSRHFHRRTHEIFDPLDADLATEYRRGDARWRPLRDRLEVPPRVRHQLRRSEPGYSVNLIQMYGPCRVLAGPDGSRLDMSDHIYC